MLCFYISYDHIDLHTREYKPMYETISNTCLVNFSQKKLPRLYIHTNNTIYYIV